MFHQWRNQRQVHGLNFQTADDANAFSTSVLEAVDKLLNPPGKNGLCSLFFP